MKLHIIYTRCGGRRRKPRTHGRWRQLLQSLSLHYRTPRPASGPTFNAPARPRSLDRGRHRAAGGLRRGRCCVGPRRGPPSWAPWGPPPHTLAGWPPPPPHASPGVRCRMPRRVTAAASAALNGSVVGESMKH
jgi:hypothetical protein